MISQKIDYLMNLTKTKNSSLGKALGLDPSYISRIRAGKRGLPLHQDFITPASEFFACQITDEFRKASAVQTLCPGKEWPADNRAAAAIIAHWMKNDASEDTPKAHELLDYFYIHEEEASVETAGTDLSFLDQDSSSELIPYSYGISGKRSSVLAFFRNILHLEKPVSLLLYTNENPGWLHENKFYQAEIMTLLKKIISRGCSVAIVQHVTNLKEILTNIKEWLPLYMTGQVYPYYLPRTRDGIMRRTLFIARGYSALVSNSIEDRTDGMLTATLTNSDAVRALEVEYREFFSLCRPLLQVTANVSEEDYTSACNRLEHKKTISDDFQFSMDFEDDRLMINTLENTGVVLYYKEPYNVLFEISEERLTAAFWELLSED